MSKQPPPAPAASALGPCPTLIQSVGRPGTGSLPSTIAPPDHPLWAQRSIRSLAMLKILDLAGCNTYVFGLFRYFSCHLGFGIWLVGCFGFNGPLRQYFSLYRAVSQREGERGERVDESKNVQTTPTRTYCKRNRPLPYCKQNCRTPRHWKFTQQHSTIRPGGGRVVRWCWVNFQCRGVLQFGLQKGNGLLRLQ